MADTNALARSIIEDMGGADNLRNVYHCMTRLRFVLKDDALADLEGVAALDGVLGTNVDGHEIQVILGPAVDSVYKAVLATVGEQAIEEAAMTTQPDGDLAGHPFKSVFQAIINAFSACMNPLVPIFVLMGMLNVIAILVGPLFFGWVSEDSDLYRNFYWAAQAVIYFLPVLLAVTAARHFKTNVFISLVLACTLLYPDLVALMADGTSQYTVFGIPAMSVTYSATVIPILLIVWVQGYVERFVQKIVPDMLKVVLEPLIVVLVMLPIGFCALGPLGNFIGLGLGAFIMWLREVAGPVETVLVGAVIPFMTAFGIGRPVFFIAMSTLLTTGSEAAYMPLALALTNFTSMGISLGFAIRSKTNEDRELGYTCFASNFLGGVSEPTLFGILLPNRGAYLPTVLGGAVGGLWLGIANVAAYQFGPSNFLSVLCFMGDEGTMNLVNGIIACVLSFGVSLIAMLVLFRKEQAGERAPKKAGAPVAGASEAA